MGLDQYAYTINKEVVENMPDIGINLINLLLDKVGYKAPTDQEYEAMSREEKKQSGEERNEAKKEAFTKYNFNQDFAYWRKFNHLHGWMHRLYNKKGGTGEFNCEAIRLHPEDIDQLEKDMNLNNLTPTDGFFFGSSELYPEDLQSLKEFIQNSRDAFENDEAVYYDSWW